MEKEMKAKMKQMVDEALKGLKDYHASWPSGLLAKALLHYYQSNRYSELSLTIKLALVKYCKRLIRSRRKTYYLQDAVAGMALIDLHQITDDNRYKVALDKLINDLKQHVSDEEGSLPYRPAQGNSDINVCTIGMVCPLLCKYGHTYGDAGSINLAVKQLRNFDSHGMDSRSGLPYHGYNYKSGICKGIIGWGRACGWLLIGMIESLLFIDPQHPDYDRIKQSYRHLVDKVENYQRADGMYSWQLSALEGNHDTSATAMILYAIAKGIEHEILVSGHRSRMVRGRDVLAAMVDGGKMGDCLTECGEFGVYPQQYGTYPWSLGPALSLFSVDVKEPHTK